MRGYHLTQMAHVWHAHAPQTHEASKRVTWRAMKTIFDLPDEPVREMKRRAVAQVNVTASGLPVVACAADALAPRMALADLLALAQQAQAQEDAQRAGHLG